MANVKEIELIMTSRRSIEYGNYRKYRNLSEREFLEKFNRAFYSLKKQYQEFLSNSFFNNNYKFWWVDSYSSTTYYRIRRRVYTTFCLIFKAAL